MTIILYIEQMEACCSRNTGTVATKKIFPDKIYKSVQPKGEDVTGMTCECGVFGAIACGDYPTQVSCCGEFRIQCAIGF